MFEVNGQTIRLSRGDTGLITFYPEETSLTENDRAVFTVRRRSGGMVMQKVIVPKEGKICVPLVNEETQALAAGEYEWDIRIALDAQVDAQGAVTDGREIMTPFPPSTMIVERVVGTI